MRYRTLGDGLDDERVVRVFVSSTFKDFEDERKILASVVFPQLREMFADRGISIVAIDLRWGLTNEVIEQQGLIDACLREIDFCSDFFGMLGARRGTLVGKDDILGSRVLKQHRIQVSANQAMSITELEFELGCFDRGRRRVDYSILFISERFDLGDSDNELLHKRVEDAGYKANRYGSIEAFSLLAFESLSSVVDARFPNCAASEDPGVRAQRKTLKQHLSGYISGNAIEQELLKRLKSKRDIFIKGDKGAGKSALFSQCVKWLSANGFDVFYYYCNTGFCVSEIDVFLEIEAYLSDRFQCEIRCSPYADYTEHVGLISEFLKSASVDAGLCLAVDAVEQLKTSRNVWMALKSLCESCPWAFCLGTGTESCGVIGDQLVMNGLERSQVEAFLESGFALCGKTMEYETLAEILDCPLYRNPIMLKGLFSELIIEPNNDQLGTCVRRLCRIGTMQELALLVVERVEGLVARFAFDDVSVRGILALISCSHYGVTEDELLRITAAPTLAWILVKNAFEYYLISFDGRYRFNHQLVEEEMGKLVSPSQRSELVKAALSEYGAKPFSDIRWCELSNWAFLSNSKAVLANVLLDARVALALLRLDRDALTVYLGSFAADESFLLELVVEGKVIERFDVANLVDFGQELLRAGCFSTCVKLCNLYLAKNGEESRLLALIARAIYKKGDYSNAFAAFERALAATRLQEGPASLPMARLLLQKSIAEKSRGGFRKARDDAREAVTVYRAHGYRGYESNWAKVFYAGLKAVLGQEDCLHDLKTALRSQAAASGEKSYAFCRLLCYSWQCLASSGDLIGADAMTQASLDGIHRATGNSPDYAWALANRSAVLAMMGKYEESRSCSLESQKINDMTSNDGRHIYSLTAYNNELVLGYLEDSETDREAALRNALQRFAPIYEVALSMHHEEHPYVLNLIANKELMCLDADPHHDGSRLLDVSEHLKAVLGQDNPDSSFLALCATRRHAQRMPIGNQKPYPFAKLDDVSAKIAAGKESGRLRLALNNGAALYLVPSFR